MSKLSASISTYGLPTLLENQNLEPYYDVRLLHTNSTETEHLELRGQAVFYPVVVTPDVFGEGRGNTSYIPVGDHEAKKGGTYMGMLVASSKLVEDLFVIQQFPQPLDTPLPTRVLTTFGGNKVHPPIRGFMLHAKRHKDIALIVGEDETMLETRTFGFMQGRSTVANLVMHGVESAIHKHARNKNSRKT